MGDAIRWFEPHVVAVGSPHPGLSGRLVGHLERALPSNPSAPRSTYTVASRQFVGRQVHHDQHRVGLTLVHDVM